MCVADTSGAGVVDLVAVCCLHPVLRGVLCCGPRLHPLDDHGGAVLPGPAARRHVRGRAHQLVRQLYRRHRLPHHAGLELNSKTKGIIY